ncbi:hypothetical protein Agabi119p4_8055 [Agaricus bisporus var. burnettii]|uniref:Uncharacterized protein n=1 Tax=Agaricus bisporus var. burnettii TaxID=192524 RepID=A0A8H7C537_AGABI|nr:hypothetical protein Agabi119p4_8055 [Agaricus bisporus var. burnettii]
MTSTVAPSTPTGRLHATCPSQDQSRYNQNKRSQSTSLTVDIGTHASSTLFKPQGWSTHVQPEGKPYFCHAKSMVTVTESWIYSAEIASEATKWIDHITSEVGKTRSDFTDVELYIRVDENLDCFYYFVDKQAQTLFWTESVTTEDVGLSPVVSASHLRIALEQEFWQHIDRFPAHFGGLPEENLLQLLDAFSYIRIDQITSSYSTFTHPAEETNAIYDILKGCRGRTHKPEVVSIIARGWGAILSSRFHNLYGEETPRIDSRHSVYVESEEDRDKGINGFCTGIMCFLTFKQLEYFREKMDTLSVDKFVQSYRVSDFIQERVREWKEQVMPSLLMLLLHASFFFITTSRVVAAISAMQFSASLLTALILIQQHNRLSHHNNPAEVIDWFGDQVLENHRTQMFAFAFALPGAFFNWGLFIFFGYWLFIGLTCFHLAFAATLVGTVGIPLCFCLYRYTRPAGVEA